MADAYLLTLDSSGVVGSVGVVLIVDPAAAFQRQHGHSPPSDRPYFVGGPGATVVAEIARPVSADGIGFQASASPTTERATDLARRLRDDPRLGLPPEYLTTGIMDVVGSGAVAYSDVFANIPVRRGIDGPGTLQVRPLVRPLPIGIYRAAQREIHAIQRAT